MSAPHDPAAAAPPPTPDPAASGPAATSPVGPAASGPAGSEPAGAAERPETAPGPPGPAPASSAAPATPPAPAQPAPRRSRAVPVLAVALVLAVAAAATLGVLLWRQAAEQRASAEALGTARAFAVTVTSYDYRELDKDFADVLDGATGEFKDQYGGASRTLRQLITDARATAKGTVLDAAVRSASTDEVVVLVFVDQEITNAVSPQPRVDRNRVTMTLTPHDGRWLVQKLELT
jgi:Mce-associated membrane protein